MKKSMSLKMLFRSPIKTLLTFLLVVAATFALFSRVMDYAITMQGTKSMEGNYHCVASLNNEVRDLYYDVAYVETRNKMGAKGYQEKQEVPDKPWPSEQKLEEFASLPGVTLSDTRYMTAGLVEDYKRPLEYETLSRYIPIVFEGTFAGYEDDTRDDILEGHVRLKFDDVKVIACEKDEEELGIGTSLKLEQAPLGDNYYIESPYTREFFDSIKEGSRCFVLGHYAGFTSDTPVGFYFEGSGAVQQYQGYLRVIDGLADNYLETEDFDREKGWVDAIEQGCYIYDMIYTSDMRALGDSGPDIITKGDTDVCYVHETFLEDHNLSVGDTINVKLGDKICVNDNYDTIDGARAYEGKDMPEFSDSVALKIIGASDSFPESYIYVPDTLLKAQVPDDYEMPWQDFSVYVEDARDIEGFLEAAEAFAEELDLQLDYSDDGWMDVKDSFQRGTQTLFLTLVLYVVGALLALTLAVYLYVGRSRKNYAIMRTLGVPGRRAGRSVVMPFAFLSALAVPLGGVSGLFYARQIAAKTLTGLMENVSGDYVLDTTLPVGVVVLCIVSELLFISLATYSFLWKMKKTPPLELLQEGTAQRKARKKALPEIEDFQKAPTGFDLAQISVIEEVPRGNYSAVRHVLSYILRHMKRGIGKTAVSLILAVVLTGGIGMSVLARYIYQDAYYQYGVKTEATQYAYTSVVSLSNSPLVKDFYCRHTLDVHVQGTDDNIFLYISNDLVRYLGDKCTVDYADGYDVSSFEGTGPLCLVGKEFAEEFDVGLGDEIGMLSGSLYYMLLNAEKKGEAGSLENGYKPYQVIGIVDSGDETLDHGVFAGIRNDLTNLYGADFMFDKCEFLLADNDRVSDLETLLEEEMNRRIVYAPYAAYTIDSEGLVNITRIQELLEVLFPIAVVAAVLIGIFVPLLVILQSAQEAAFLRILGATKKRVRCMLMFEQVIISIAGIILMAGGIALFSPGLFARSWDMLAACFGLYLLGGICGAAAAAVQVTRQKVLELLQVKE